MDTKPVTPMLFPYDPAEYWDQLRKIIREEIKVMDSGSAPVLSYETPGMTYKPLYKMKEVCALLGVTRPTIYEWVKLGKLRPYKIRSRVYFLWDDIHKLLHPE